MVTSNSYFFNLVFRYRCSIEMTEEELHVEIKQELLARITVNSQIISDSNVFCG